MYSESPQQLNSFLENDLQRLDFELSEIFDSLNVLESRLAPYLFPGESTPDTSERGVEPCERTLPTIGEALSSLSKRAARTKRRIDSINERIYN